MAKRPLKTHSTGCAPAPQPDPEELLRRNSRSVTGPRAAILRLLQSRPHPLTIRQVIEALPPGSCNLATVYRSLHLLEKMSLVRRFDFGDGKARFEMVHDKIAAHHHHLICVECSEVVEIEECFPPDLETRIARKNGFSEITHRLEFFGRCPSCAR